MRNKTTVAVALFLLVAVLSGPVALAQEPGMVRVTTINVQLGHQQHFESLVPKLWEAYKKAGGTGPVFASAGVSDPGAYTFVSPISSLADIAAQEEAFGKTFAAAPQVMTELMGTITSIDDEVWATRSDLAYVPASPRLKMEEQAFGRIALIYVYPAQVAAFEAVLKERSALRKKHGIADGVDIAQLVLGADGPAYAVLMGAKDEADFYTQFAKDTAKMGAEWTESLQKSGTMLRRVEFVTSVSRPALELQP